MAMAADTAPPHTPYGRWAVTGVFFLNGLMYGSFLVRLPSLKDELQLSTVQLGAMSTIFGASAVLAMQFIGALVSRYGSRRLIRAVLLLLPLVLVGVGLSPGFGALVGVSVLLGILHGSLDVSMNAHAVATERQLQRPIMNGCHAAWSISAVVASLVGAGVMSRGVPTSVHLGGVAAAVLVSGLIVGSGLLPASADQSAGRGREAGAAVPRPSWRTGWSRALVLFGLAGTVLMVIEGGTVTWAAVFLHDSRGASLTVASFGLTAFAACQTAGRLVGDRLTMLVGAPRVFRVGGLVAAAGLALAVLSPLPAGAVAGFAVVGLGGSFLIPLTFSAAGHAGGTGPGAAAFVARFTTFTYAGILVGPAAIGWVAGAIGLQWTLTLLVPLLFVVAVLTRLPTRAAADTVEVARPMPTLSEEELKAPR
jgi:MFS family permease